MTTNSDTRRYSDEYYLAEAGVPKRYRGASAADFNFVLPEVNDHGVFITGPAGHGKTHLATAIMRANLDLGLWLNENFFPPTYTFSGIWISTPDLFSRIKDTFNKKGASERDVVSKYINTSLMVLDDIGAEKGSEWSLSALYLILSERVNAMRPTIVTSNLNRKELDAIDPRLASRIGGMTPFLMKGMDRRKVSTGAR